jgi:TatD DNase family protein
VIDTHCHLTFPELSTDMAGGVRAVLDRAAAQGVQGCISISTTPSDALNALAVATAHHNVWSTAGVHPLYSDEGPHDWSQLRLAASHERCVAWGELGLDNHYKEPAASLQREVLAQQLALIETCANDAKNPIRKPIVIHCREAFADLLPILRSGSLPRDRYVFHCFTGTLDDARAVLDFGAWISFTGVVTYKNAQNVRDAAKLCPIDRIMVETDAPFLPPEPHRSARPCEPWMASITARAIAALRGMPFEDFNHILDENTHRFFGIRASSPLAATGRSHAE